MPPAAFHTYHRKLQIAGRRADTAATPAQREAGVARVGKVYLHGLEVSLEYPRGAIRKGTRPDGSTWSRVINAAGYGYINRTESPSDKEQVDVWIGDHPQSQLVFVVELLTAGQEHDEFKCVLGCRNLAEAKKLIKDNYPPGFLEDRVGEIRGVFLPEFKKHLRDAGLMKKKAAGMFCRRCAVFYKGRAEKDGCPECDPDGTKTAWYSDEKFRKLRAWVVKEFSPDDLSGTEVRVQPDRGHAIVDTMDWGDPAVGERIGKKLERAYGKGKVIHQNEGGLPKPGVDGWKKLAESREAYAARNEAAKVKAQDSQLLHVREGYIHCTKCHGQFYANPADDKCPDCGAPLMRARSVRRG